jgi:long-subunit acyl-CoA synthetase (AMP-forming)
VVALLLDNRPEFNLVAAAVLHLGAVPFSLGHPAPAEQAAYRIANAKPAQLITEHALRDAAGSFDPIVYTSGTSGVPKGVELAHRVILSSLRGVAEMAPVTPGDRTLAFLPTAHIADVRHRADRPRPVRLRRSTATSARRSRGPSRPLPPAWTRSNRSSASTCSPSPGAPDIDALYA